MQGGGKIRGEGEHYVHRVDVKSDKQWADGAGNDDGWVTGCVRKRKTQPSEETWNEKVATKRLADKDLSSF